MRNIMRNCTIFADGVSKHLEVEQIQLPTIADALQEYRGGGMDLPLDVPHGLQKLEAGFNLTSVDPQTLGLLGLGAGTTKRFIARGAIIDETDGVVKTGVAIMTGRLTSGAPNAWQAGEKSGAEYQIASIRYYKLTVEDQLVHEIDAINMRRVIFGVDQLANVRAALGL